MTGRLIACPYKKNKMKKNYIQPSIEVDPVYSMALCQGPVLPGSDSHQGDTKERNQFDQDDNKSSDYGTLW